MIQKVVPRQALAGIQELWSPRPVAEVNGQQVRLARIHGEFVWHRHEREDELFLVIRGRFRMDLRDGAVSLEEGDLLVVPRGVEHRPVADEEAWILLVEPPSTRRTGDGPDPQAIPSPSG